MTVGPVIKRTHHCCVRSAQWRERQSPQPVRHLYSRSRRRPSRRFDEPSAQEAAARVAPADLAELTELTELTEPEVD